jgi:hypothetical protein
VAVAGVGGGAFCVAVVEAAVGADVGAAGDHVHAFGLAVDGDAGGGAEIAVADAR